MNKTIHLPAVAEPTDRQLLAEIKTMIRKYSVASVVEIKTWEGLRKRQKLLELKIKSDETKSNNPKGPSGPSGGNIRA